MGTGPTTDVSLQLVGVAAVPLNVTVLVPGVPPKLVPVIVTDVPIGPEVGDKLLMLGVRSTVIEGVALVPLNVRVFVP